MKTTRHRYTRNGDIYPQQVIRRALANGAIALGQVDSGTDQFQVPLFVVATHDNAVAHELMFLDGWHTNGDGDLYTPGSEVPDRCTPEPDFNGTQVEWLLPMEISLPDDVEYNGDALEFLSLEEWRALMIEYGGGVHVGRIGRANFQKVINLAATPSDELEVESWEGNLWLPSDSDNTSQVVAAIRPLEGAHVKELNCE